MLFRSVGVAVSPLAGNKGVPEPVLLGLGGVFVVGAITRDAGELD